MTARDLAALASALVPLGIAIVEHQGRVEAEGVTQDVIRAVSASLEGVGGVPCYGDRRGAIDAERSEDSDQG